MTLGVCELLRLIASSPIAYLAMYSPSDTSEIAIFVGSSLRNRQFFMYDIANGQEVQRFTLQRPFINRDVEV